MDFLGDLLSSVGGALSSAGDGGLDVPDVSPPSLPGPGLGDVLPGPPGLGPPSSGMIGVAGVGLLAGLGVGIIGGAILFNEGPIQGVGGRGTATAFNPDKYGPPPTLQKPPNSGRLALLIGINYRGTNNELRGCGNDCYLMYEFLTRTMGWHPSDITVLTDDEKVCKKIGMRQQIHPSARNIFNAFHYIAEASQYLAQRGVKPQIVFCYSGHGTSVRDYSGDEADGYDEAIVPVDSNHEGCIIDDTIRRRFLQRLPPSAEMMALMDCCHSGTILDLKYSWIPGSTHCRVEHSDRALDCIVFLISGCRDDQTSADSFDDSRNRYTGAMTSAFIDAYVKSRHNVYMADLVNAMTVILQQRRMTQRPQVSGSRTIDQGTGIPLTVWTQMAQQAMYQQYYPQGPVKMNQVAPIGHYGQQPVPTHNGHVYHGQRRHNDGDDEDENSKCKCVIA